MPKVPLVPGREMIGRIEDLGEGVAGYNRAKHRSPWLGWTCGQCAFCFSNREDLCSRARFTGYTIDSRYADYTVANASFCFPLPDAFNDTTTARSSALD